MPLSRRRVLLFLALALTLFATYRGAQREGNDIVGALSRPPAQTAEGLRHGKPAAPAHAALAPISARPAETGNVADLFDSKVWSSPTPAPAEPPKPTAPALPFAYMGRFVEKSEERVFLVQGDRIHVVRAGDVVDSTYRVEKIEGAVMTLTYLPLGMQQTLSLGEAR